MKTLLKFTIERDGVIYTSTKAAAEGTDVLDLYKLIDEAAGELKVRIQDRHESNLAAMRSAQKRR